MYISLSVQSTPGKGLKASDYVYLDYLDYVV